MAYSHERLDVTDLEEFVDTRNKDELGDNADLPRKKSTFCKYCPCKKEIGFDALTHRIHDSKVRGRFLH